MAQTAVRFGILGCANIARQLSRAIALSSNTALCAVASRSVEKAQKFVADNSLPSTVKIYGEYGEVLDDPDIDAVYIPLPTTLHVKWAVAAAEKKKHVLLEKPVALDVAELDRILEACESNGVQFMDGTVWVHHPRTGRMKEALGDERCFGQLKLIHSVLGYNAGPDFLKNDIRVKPDLDALGALGDIGWYCIRSILWAADYELPKTVVAMHKPVYNDLGVILSTGASLYWEDGKVATFYCSFLSHMTFDLTVLGTKGALRVNDLVSPFQESYGSFSLVSESDFAHLEPGRWAPVPQEHRVGSEVPQEVLMVNEFAKSVAKIRGEGLKPDWEWAKISRMTQLVMDAVKASMEKGFQAVEPVEYS
ncbi:hypothetical protein ACJRO7_014815 [Eucalyptus globulus]|uniref:Gfo/Idh/MocA-like oxidoreductase N-terminal domain-containing protein n=1 Tax=Eucalyptus globulus TaxID=34317 RepID=A0ABD3L2G7_EUCGL